ncbi:hypothetical protein GCK72_004164 [Caenorhabditis remanei]|uniref:F-box domain-containing protein n=1 Tax=Caenorhabditis remanei TaxID=31234 RepID=A0A6A5HAQ0_CAERE|nr:hypothetical protein GCK72_004164 [Caenorhabditis remanei]KAF1764217.1 hypothetical protein GCK72_004164 [Caenorhabditis remanei]
MHRSICSQILCLKWFKSPQEEVFTSDSKVSIMDMPDLVMRKILGNVGFTTIMKLRKVCHAFRNFIDDSKLNYGLTQVNVWVQPSLIRVVMFRSSANTIILNYAKYATSSLVNITESDRRSQSNLETPTTDFDESGTRESQLESLIFTALH